MGGIMSWATILPKKTGAGVRRAYTVQYDAGTGQREKSFATMQEAKDFRTEVAYKGREGSFVDPRRASGSFTEYARTVVEAMAVASGSKKLYAGMLDAWIAPWAGPRTLAQVAGDREGATTLVNKTMTSPDGVLLSYTRRAAARGVLIAVCDEAVRAGRLASHRLAGINLAHSDVVTERKDFVFPSHKEVSLMAAESGIVVWLMRGCGLRVCEAHAVAREDFREGGTMLRVSGQASLDGRRKVPLKHRHAGEYRDVPVPDYLWAMVDALPDGPVCRGAQPGASYPTYNHTYKSFVKAAKRIGLPPASRRTASATPLLPLC